ncbi:hypothetical protein [Lentzea sp.]|uniref:hypothetical protein n=1 Tax=Lentzea sp. TaxID=56099 RepID=UPI002CBF142C|nr:hypothetical protein [Lentzea sp.]HUQ55725.1 hypothetical protein [Lentzea sp.]
MNEIHIEGSGWRTPRLGFSFDLAVGVLPGGRYRRTVPEGDPPALHERIGPAMEDLKALAPWDSSRPLVEFYRRHTVIELWVPIS